jgi:hypothetical protein
MLQYGIRAQKAKLRLFLVALPNLLVAGDVTIWYQSHGYNTEPRWAMLEEVEAIFLERIVVKVDKI